MANFVEPLLTPDPQATAWQQLFALVHGYESLLRLTVAIRLRELQEFRPEPSAGPLGPLTGAEPFPLARLRRPSFGIWLQLAQRLEQAETTESELLPGWRAWLRDHQAELNEHVQWRNDLAHGRAGEATNERLSRVSKRAKELLADCPWWTKLQLATSGGVIVRLDEAPKPAPVNVQVLEARAVVVTREGRSLDLWPFLTFESPDRGVVPRLLMLGGIDERGRGLEMDVLGAAQGEKVHVPRGGQALETVAGLFPLGDWIDEEASTLYGRQNAEGRHALLAEMERRVDAHQARVPLVLEADPGSGKTAILAALVRSLRARGMAVAAYAPRAAPRPGLDGLCPVLEKIQAAPKGSSKRPIEKRLLDHADEIRKRRGHLVLILDGLDECGERTAFAAMAAKLADAGHTVVVGTRSSGLEDPDQRAQWLPILYPGESLALTRDDIDAWMRDAAHDPQALEALQSPRGAKWIERVTARAQGLALYVSILVEGLNARTLRVGDKPPSLDDEWNRMLDRAGTLDDEGSLAPLLLVLACQVPTEGLVARELIDALLGAPASPVLPRVQDFLRRMDPFLGGPFHELLRSFVLKTQRLERTRQLAKQRWLDTAFSGKPSMHQAATLLDLPTLAHRLGAEAEGWNRFVESGAALRWMAETPIYRDHLGTLSKWARVAGANTPPSLQASVALFRELGNVPSALAKGSEDNALDFLRDRVAEAPASSPIRCLACGLSADLPPRSCSRVNPIAALQPRIRFPGPVEQVALGESGRYVAALTYDGTLCVDDVVHGEPGVRHAEPNLAAPRHDALVAVSDKLQCAAAWAGGSHDEIVVLFFGESPARIERYAWLEDDRCLINGARVGPFLTPHDVLAYFAAEPDPNAARERALDPGRSEIGLSARVCEDDWCDVELRYEGGRGASRGPDERGDEGAALSVVGSHLVVRRGCSVQFFDFDGRPASPALMLTDKVWSGPPGVAELALWDEDCSLRRLELVDGKVELRRAGHWGLESVHLDGPRWLLRDQTDDFATWIGPQGEILPYSMPRVVGGLHATLSGENEDGLDFGVTIRDHEDRIVADWWGRTALWGAVMLTSTRLAVLEGPHLVILDVNLPS